MDLHVSCAVFPSCTLSTSFLFIQIIKKKKSNKGYSNPNTDHSMVPQSTKLKCELETNISYRRQVLLT